MTSQFRKSAIVDYPLASETTSHSKISSKSSSKISSTSSKVASSSTTGTDIRSSTADTVRSSSVPKVSSKSTASTSVRVQPPYGVDACSVPTHKVDGFGSTDETNRKFDTPFNIDLVDLKLLVSKLQTEYDELVLKRQTLQSQCDSTEAEVQKQKDMIEREASARNLVFVHGRWIPADKHRPVQSIDFSDSPHLVEEEEMLHLQVENKHLEQILNTLRAKQQQGFEKSLVEPALVAVDSTTEALERLSSLNANDDEQAVQQMQQEEAMAQARVEAQRQRFAADTAEHEGVMRELQAMNEAIRTETEQTRTQLEQTLATIKQLSDAHMRLEAKCAALQAMQVTRTELNAKYPRVTLPSASR